MTAGAKVTVPTSMSELRPQLELLGRGKHDADWSVCALVYAYCRPGTRYKSRERPETPRGIWPCRSPSSARSACTA